MHSFNNDSNKITSKKKRSIVVAAVVALLLLVTGTFAWRDYRQHKTNVMSGKGISRDVVLVEDFDGTTDDWNKDEAVKKEISVRNKGEGDAYVRIKLSEYMEIGDADNEYSNLRYMIDSKGNYVSALAAGQKGHEAMNQAIIDLDDTEQVIKDLFKDGFEESDVASKDENDQSESKRIHKLTDINNETRYFIATEKSDPNGQYGKHISLDKAPLSDKDVNPENIITGGGENKDTRPDAGDKHHEVEEVPVNSQCKLFDPINYLTINTDERDNAAKEYVELIYGDAVTNESSNIQADGAWYYEDGYFYYSLPLKAKSTDQEPTVGKDLSKNILDKLNLRKQPNGDFIYEFHADLEAVSWDEIDDGTWDAQDIPTVLFTKWQELEK